MKENRKHERVDSRLRCWCEGDDVTVYARVGNLSEGGLFLRTSLPLSEGSTARVRLKQPEGSEISAHARVVWIREGENGSPAGMGLQFEALDEDAKAAIRRIVQSEQRQSSRT